MRIIRGRRIKKGEDYIAYWQEEEEEEGVEGISRERIAGQQTYTQKKSSEG